jgi:hypothetical protein
VKDVDGSGGDDKGGCGDAHDLRCICRNLVARRRGDGIELKCRRCRRLLILEFVEGGQVEVSVLDG